MRLITVSIISIGAGSVAVSARPALPSISTKSFTPFAGKNDIHVVCPDDKGQTTSLPFRYGDVEDGDELDSIIQLKSGDTIIVP